MRRFDSDPRLQKPQSPEKAIRYRTTISFLRFARSAARVTIALMLVVTMLTAQQKPFPVVSTVDAPTIAGHPVQLDAQGKLLPWPMPDDIGYSYASHVLTQWQILWDQHNRQRLHYNYCCFDFDRTTFEMFPDQH